MDENDTISDDEVFNLEKNRLIQEALEGMTAVVKAPLKKNGKRVCTANAPSAIVGDAAGGLGLLSSPSPPYLIPPLSSVSFSFLLTSFPLSKLS